MRTLLMTCLCVAACSNAPVKVTDGGVDAATLAAPGCANAAPSLPADGSRTLSFHGVQRSYLVHVPASYVAGTPMAVVVGLHGDTPASFGDAASFFRMTMTNMIGKSDSAGFILATPEGIIDDASTGASWNAGSCCATDKTRDDVGFVKDVVSAISAEFCVDPKRVFAAGYSSGAFMSYRLACEASDVFAAIASAAGLTGVDPCTPGRAVSIIDFAGTSDPNVPYAGGASGDVTTNTASWVAREACGAQSAQTFSNGDTHCDTYSGCTQKGEITLCTVQGGGHAWPGGLDVSSYGLGKTTTDLIANDAMWDFFVKHPMP